MNNNQTGQCILLVEDEMLLGMMLEDLLLDAGYQVSRATGLADALVQLDRVDFDAAILDIHLGDKDVFPLASRLRSSGIPFVFASASDAACIGAEFRQYPLIVKPYTVAQVEQSLDRMLRSRSEEAQRVNNAVLDTDRVRDPLIPAGVMPRTAVRGSHVS